MSTPATPSTPSEAGAISAVVLTRNEAAHVVPCLRTLQWANEVLVVDSGSTDGTVTAAAAMGARVLHRRWEGWAVQRNFALEHARGRWIFFVDADERVSLELAREIQQRVDAAGRHDRVAGFWVPRQNIILGVWMKHAGWYPDYQLRLFVRQRGRYDPARPVHELVTIDGTTERLRNELVHHNYVSWRQFWTKQRRYARLEAQALHAHAVRVRPHALMLQPWREFWRRYWTLQGYRAGWLGLCLSAALAVANFWTYFELWRRQAAGAGSGR